MMFLEYTLGEFDHEMRTARALSSGTHTIFSMPRAAVLRPCHLNDTTHHRGLLSVHLQLLDVPLPSISGPTASGTR
jgi:hypothetical protein